MKFKSTLLIPVFSAIALSGCGDDSQKAPFTINSTAASDFAYALANQPAVDITLQQDENNFCNVTFLRSNVKQGYKASVEQKNSGELSASCYWNKAQYIQSSKHPTLASLSIVELDPELQSATLAVSLKLVDSKSLSDYFEVKETIFTLSGDQFTNLVTMP